MAVVTEEEMQLCYGTLHVENRKDQCKRRSECPWGESCLSRASEEAESIHYHRANVSIGFMVFAPNSSLSNEKNIDPELEALMVADDANENALSSVELENARFDADTYDAICSVLAKLADIYFDKPTVFEMLMKKIYKGYNQSDLAREKGITRAGMNKRLLCEINVGQKRNNFQERQEIEIAKAKKEYSEKMENLKKREAFLSQLSDRDWHIYKLAFVDGCTLNSVAKQLNIGTSTVDRVVRFLRLNLNENGAIKKGRRAKK